MRMKPNRRVFHGSPHEFGAKEFRRSEHGLFGPGVYFTDNRDDAEWYATKFGELGHVYACEVELENPLEYHRLFHPSDLKYSDWLPLAYPSDLQAELLRIFRTPKDRAKKLMDLGFDGIVVHFERSGSREYPHLDHVSSPDVATESYYIVLDPDEISDCAIERVEPRERMSANGSEYRGAHRAPGPEENSPLWDVTLAGSFPDDVYSSMGPRYYGAGDGSDMSAWSVVLAARNRPSKPVKIYRAVPKTKSKDERLAELEAIKKFILKHGKVPSYVTTSQSPSAYYEMVSKSAEVLRREAEEEDDPSPRTINVGDWVTLDRKYAVQHGESNLGGRGNYKILSKTVPASALWTDGNSIQEWGYYP